MIGLRGLCIFLRNGLQCSPFRTEPRDGVESLCLHIPLHGSDSLLLGSIYRSPSSCLRDSTEKMCELLEQIHKSGSSHILITGDFNYPDIDWETSGCRLPRPDHPTNMFMDTLQDCFLFQHINKPTRFRLGTEPSLLDLVISNEEGMVDNVEYLPGLGSSDHLIIRFRVVCYTSPHGRVFKEKPALYKADYEVLRQQASEICWDQVQALELCQAYSFFLSNVHQLVDKYVPKSKPGRTKNLYMNREALRLRKRKRTHWAQYLRSKSPLDHAKYARMRNKLRKETRRLRKDFEIRLAEELKSNPKSFWRYVNTRMKTKPGIDVLEDDVGRAQSSPEKKAEILNNFFSSVFVDENLNVIPEPRQQQYTEVMPDVTISAAEVEAKLRSLNATGAPGPDGLHPRVLMELSPCVASPLSSIFTKSLELSELPESWRRATVIPVHKKGSRHLANNYRPISLTAIPCKIMESIIRDKIMQHLSSNQLLSPHQHGFRPSRSCSTQLLEVLDEWTQAVDRGVPMDAVYLDFQKAFDSVPHVRLIEKLKSYGISGQVLGWIRSFLEGRTQQVLVDGAYSSQTPVKSGVPQGSVLGPLMFLIYINDLPDSVLTSVKMFADDSKLYGPADSPDSRQLLQDDLHRLSRWSEQWQLPFNVSKCKVLHIGPRNPCSNYKMSGKDLECCEQERDLGIIVDGTLRFHSQASSAAAKANQLLGIIRRSFASLTASSLPLLYKTLIRPHLEFGNSVWGPMSRGDQKLVEKVQRRATKLVPELRTRPYKERLQELRLPSLTYRRLRGDMIVIYQILHRLLDVDQDMLQLSTTRHTRGHELKLDILRARTLPRRHFLSVRAAATWNGLPASVVSAPSLASFKSRIDTHWKDILYNSVFDD